MVRHLYARLILFHFLLVGLAGFVFWLLAIFWDWPEPLALVLVGGSSWLVSAVVVGLLLQPIDHLLLALKRVAVREPARLTALAGPDAEAWRQMLLELEATLGIPDAHSHEKNAVDWQAVLDSLSEGVMVTDTSGKPVWGNSALRALAHTGSDMGGQDFDRGLHTRCFVPEQLALIEEEMLRHPDHPRTDIIQLDRPRQFVRRYSASLRAAGKRHAGFLVSYQDMTHAVEQDRLRQDFIANASHELRTPVTSVKVLLENLVDGAKDDPAVRDEFLNDALREIDRMRELVNDLLDVAALEAGRERLTFAPFEVSALIGDAVETVAPQARQRDVVLRVEPHDTDFQMVGDRARLRQVLVNLVANAVKFTPAGGHVTVRAERDAAAGRLGFVIADTGIGIPAKDLPHIFDRFFRVTRGRSRLQGGSGLGLTIVKQAIDAHGGEIHVESTEGQGTTVFVSLPLQQVEPGDPPEREA